MSAYSLQRCVIHPLHSKVGVCALCLRERLLALEEDRSHSVSADDSSTPPDLLPPLLPRHGSTSTSTSTSALDNKPAESVKETDSNVVPLDRPQQRLADEWIPENCTIPPPPFPTFLHHRLKLKTLTIPPPSPDRPPSATATAMAMASSQDATTGISHQKFNPNPSRFSNFVTPRRSNASELADHVNNVRLNCSTAKQPQKSPAAAAAAAILQQQDGGLSRVDLQQEPASECSLPDQGNHRTALSSSSPLHPRSIHNSSAATSTNWIASLFHRGSRKNKQSSSSSSSSSKKNRNHGNISGLEYHIGPEKFHGNEEGPIVPCRMSVDGSGLKPSCPGLYKPKPHWADNETRGSIYSVKPHHHQSKCDTCATNASPASLGERLSTARLTFKLEQRKLVEPNPDSTWARSDGHVDVEIRRPAALFERSRSCGSSTYSIAEFPNCPSSKNEAARPKRSCGPSPAHVSIPKHSITGVGARNGKDSRLSLGSYLSSPFRKSAAAMASRKQAAVHHL